METANKIVGDPSKVTDLAEAIRKASPGIKQDGSGDPGALPGERKDSPEDNEVKEKALQGIGELLALPGDVMHAMTDNDRWAIGEKEKALLDKKGAPALTLMIETSPEQLVKQMFYFTLIAVYGPRLIAEVKDMIIEIKKKKEAQP